MTEKVKFEFEISSQLMLRIHRYGFDLHDNYQALFEAALNDYLDSYAATLQQDYAQPDFDFKDVRF